MKNKNLAARRIAIVLFYALSLFLFVYVMLANPLQNDVFGIFVHDASIFHCPSCGATRAVYCFFRLDFKQAFYYHAYFTVISPVIAYIILCVTVNGFFNKKIIPYPKHYAACLYVLFALWMAFSVARNFTNIIF